MIVRGTDAPRAAGSGGAGDVTDMPISSRETVRLGSGFERWTERHLRILMLAPAMVILAGLTLFPTVYMFASALPED